MSSTDSTVRAGVVYDVLRAAKLFASDDTTRPHMHGVRVYTYRDPRSAEPAHRSLRFSATDGHRAVVIDLLDDTLFTFRREAPNDFDLFITLPDIDSALRTFRASGYSRLRLHVPLRIAPGGLAVGQINEPDDAVRIVARKNEGPNQAPDCSRVIPQYLGDPKGWRGEKREGIYGVNPRYLMDACEAARIVSCHVDRLSVTLDVRGALDPLGVVLNEPALRFRAVVMPCTP
jgi:hypothetical protein